MFKYMIIQLENAGKVIFDGALCRTFLTQAYQESLALRPELHSEKEINLMQRFYDLNAELIELSDNRFNTKQLEYKEVIAELIVDMKTV